MHDLTLPLPPLAEQHEIARRLALHLRLAEAVEARITRAGERLERMRQALLAKAFRGELVPQDPNNEPAAAMLERIRAANGKAEANGRGARRAARSRRG